MCRRVYIVFCCICITYIVYTYIKRKSGKANFMLVVRVWKPYKYLLEWRHILLYFCAHIMLNSKHFIIISYVFFFLVLYVCQQLIIFYYVKVIVRLHKLRIFFFNIFNAFVIANYKNRIIQAFPIAHCQSFKLIKMHKTLCIQYF